MTSASVIVFFTNFADLAVTLPAFVVLAAALIGGGWRRGGLAWIIGMAGTMLFVAAAKMLIDVTGPVAGIISPSGHTMVAGTAIGGLWSLGRYGLDRQPGVMVRAAGLAVIVACLVGLTRVVLGDHTVADVAVMIPFAAAAAMFLIKAAGPRPAGMRLRPAFLAIGLTVAAMHGRHLGAEQTIARLADYTAYLSPRS